MIHITSEMSSSMLHTHI